MVEIEIYSSLWCPFCYRAKHLLKNKGAAFAEYDVDGEPARRSEMVSRSGGRRTVPQIFIGGTHVGGSDELAALERAGRLDVMLEAGTP
ncbi:MAG: glutaredoxin 3 [Alphaproteobacteria bacterium]|nr:glutaredoxin 3 [Alphaproteobacteria bacterium]